MHKIFATLLFILRWVSNVSAQHDHMKGMNMHPQQAKVAKAPNASKDSAAQMKAGKMDMSEQGMSEKDTNEQDMTDIGMKTDDMHMDMKMNHSFSLNLPMNRDGSGTSWAPDNAAMYGYMVHSSGWMFMFHGNVFIRYNNQDFTNKGSRGGSQVDAPNMLMAMGQRQIGQKGLFHFGTMFSLDAVVTGGSGYPLLFQTGETWQGIPLIDRQHPHDLFSELSVSYAYAFTKKADAFIYVGYPGEPALGPVTFMHRNSGMYNPDAPISHHWADATHITFGVATLGVRYGKFKLEGSSFTGREPDENRYNFDKPTFNSRSARLSFNPGKVWALQVSHGFLKSPEAAHPEENIYRTTASATYSYKIAGDKFFDATAMWALNKIPNQAGSDAALIEATLRLRKTAIYSRYERVRKTCEELVLDANVYGANTLFPINAFTLGAGYDLLHIRHLTMAMGGQISMYHADGKLDALYGKNPLAGELYLHFYPSIM